jgi:uncharacterized protein (DUF433 family)
MAIVRFKLLFYTQDYMYIPVIQGRIEITPGICGGKPRIAGHRIRVQDIVIWHEHMGMSPDEIVDRYPSITLADVYAALAYDRDRQDEIRSSIEADEEFARQLKSQTPSLLLQTLKKLQHG